MEEIIALFESVWASLFAGMTVMGVVMVWLAIAAVGLLLTYLIRIHIAYRMAKNRHRDPLAWVLLSFFFSPLLTWIILLIVGDQNN